MTFNRLSSFKRVYAKVQNEKIVLFTKEWWLFFCLTVLLRTKTFFSLAFFSRQRLQFLSGQNGSCATVLVRSPITFLLRQHYITKDSPEQIFWHQFDKDWDHVQFSVRWLLSHVDHAGTNVFNSIRYHLTTEPQ